MKLLEEMNLTAEENILDHLPNLLIGCKSIAEMKNIYKIYLKEKFDTIVKKEGFGIFKVNFC